MKNTWLWILGGVAVLYFLKQRQQQQAQAAISSTASTVGNDLQTAYNGVTTGISALTSVL